MVLLRYPHYVAGRPFSAETRREDPKIRRSSGFPEDLDQTPSSITARGVALRPHSTKIGRPEEINLPLAGTCTRGPRNIGAQLALALPTPTTLLLISPLDCPSDCAMSHHAPTSAQVSGRADTDHLAIGTLKRVERLCGILRKRKRRFGQDRGGPPTTDYEIPLMWSR